MRKCAKAALPTSASVVGDPKRKQRKRSQPLLLNPNKKPRNRSVNLPRPSKSPRLELLLRRWKTLRNLPKHPQPKGRVQSIKKRMVKSHQFPTSSGPPLASQPPVKHLLPKPLPRRKRARVQPKMWR